MWRTITVRHKMVQYSHHSTEGIPCSVITNSDTVILCNCVPHIRFYWLVCIFKSCPVICIRRFNRHSKSQYRFEVTVDYLLPVQHLQAPEESVGKPADEGETEALEVIFFDELVQVDPVRRNNNSKHEVSNNLFHFPPVTALKKQWLLKSDVTSLLTTVNLWLSSHLEVGQRRAVCPHAISFHLW